MSILTSYLLAFVPSAYIGVLFLSWIQVCYMHMYPETYLSGLKITLTVTTVLIIICSVVAWLITNPFTKIVNQLKEENRAATEDEKNKVFKTYSALNILTIIGCVTGFIVGNTVSLFLKIKSGGLPNDPIRVTMAIIHSIIFGALVCFYVMFITNEVFAKYRKLLHLHVVESRPFYKRISFSICIVAISGLLFVFFNMFLVPYGIINTTAPQYLEHFIKSGIRVGVISILMALGILVIILNGLKTRIRDTKNAINEIRDGSLANRLDVTMMDDFAELTTSINQLIKKLNVMVKELRSESEVVTNTANKLAEVSGTAENALGIMTDSFTRIENEGTKQNQEIRKAESNVSDLTKSVRQVETHVLQETSAMTQSSASITEMTENIKSVAVMTKKADDVSMQLSDSCAAGNVALKNTSATVESVHEAVSQVQMIVKTIQDISNRTNLLSMNASIEAAHAGDAGKGFSVVANEVRSLAANSSKSATEIQDLIQSMVEKIESSVQSIGETQESFRIIQDCSEQNSNLSRTIASAMEEQKSGAEETMRATESVVSDTQEIKELVTDQNSLTQNVETSMKSVVESSNVMIDAIRQSAQSSASVQDVISDINQMIRQNKDAVANMTKVLNQFNVD